MRKSIAFITLLIMLASFSACKVDTQASPTAEPAKPTETANNTPITTDDFAHTDKPSNDYPEHLGNVFRLWLYDENYVYVNTPTGFAEYENGYTDFFYVPEEKYVAFTAVTEKDSWTLKTAHDKIMDTFKWTSENISRIYDLKIVSEETRTINDIEVYCYEADMGVGLDRAESQYYLIGYSFLFQDIPCNITGVVMDESQSEELKAEVRQIVDDMMHTVRDHK